MSINPTSFLSMIKAGNNPQQLMMSYLQEQSNSSPMMQNLFTLARQGDTASIENIARNIVEGQGKNYDQEFAKFKQQFGFK